LKEDLKFVLFLNFIHQYSNFLSHRALTIYNTRETNFVTAKSYHLNFSSMGIVFK
jgi:hypothetical protein